MEIKISKCPYCNGTSGFQIEQTCRGSFLIERDFNGEHIESSYDESMNYGKENTPICIDCRKPLGRWIKQTKIDSK